ncbi:hypothetical protein [Sinorhizobium meliloti]|uniref:hypothetical protein n=1 Tax=Rhizobium meliloti TaxID=382 RepID=UPI003F5CD0D0
MHLFGKANGPFPAGDERLEQSPALVQRQTAQVVTVEMEQIEGIEEDGAGFIRLPSTRLLLLADVGWDFRWEPSASFQPVHE